MTLSIVILAAGQGTRMKSSLPKVLHPLAKKPLLQHVIETAHSIKADNIYVVYGHGGNQVIEELDHTGVNWVEQAEQLGTGHAVDQAISLIDSKDTVLVLYGDVPLTKSSTLDALVSKVSEKSMGLLTVRLDDPSGYGRIVRNQSGKVESIVEQKDASADQLKIDEVNTGLLAVNADKLHSCLKQLENNNAQGEYYLTDIIAMAVSEGISVETVNAESESEVMGVNDKRQLAELERHFQREQADKLMLQGVTLADPARIDIRGEVQVGTDVSIDVNVILEGNIKIGNHVSIGPNNIIKNTSIADNVEINANCVIEDAEIGADSRIGPFARVRPESKLAEQTHIGNFVEIKKSKVGKGSKINHLSYIGDSIIGKDVNIGAGTITCNYDGANKHQTIIEDNVFVGSDTQLVAPVKVGSGATIAAGTTITKDVPADELVLSRVKQESRKGWKRPTKKKK
jgi:bifunctional UDP-N-acetylglucosamine pyrophosphorylase/glucosamine-1-phosphate N-acetyltransferase